MRRASIDAAPPLLAPAHTPLSAPCAYAQVSKETYDKAKETYDTAKETYNKAKETY